MLLSLAFVLAGMLGVIADFCCYDLVTHARAVSDGKPLPLLTKLLFDYLGRWHNGAVLAVFLIPWAGLVLITLRDRPRSSQEASMLWFIYGFACWACMEALLFAFVLFFSVLPLITHYKTPLHENIPAGAYVPHIILGALAALTLGLGVKRWSQRN